MKIITPTLFRDNFDSVVMNTTIKSKLLSNWNHYPNYTHIIRNEALPEIAKNIGLNSYTHKDYYWLDGIFYEEKDAKNFKENSIYAKNISVAIEHEHVHGGTVVEMNKLQIYNTPLKVLITYPGTDERAKILLSKYNKIIEDADIFSDFLTHRKQLVIFGIRQYENIIWQYYVYTGHGINGFDKI